MISSDLDEDVVRFWPKMGQKSSKRAIRKGFSTAGLSNNYHSNEGKKTENPRLCKKFSRKLAASSVGGVLGCLSFRKIEIPMGSM